MKFIRHIIVAATATALVLGGTTGTAASANPARGNSVVNPNSQYVVSSVPLNGDWNNGYVQMWYDTATEKNWGPCRFPPCPDGRVLPRGHFQRRLHRREHRRQLERG